MIGMKYWTTGITVTYGGAGRNNGQSWTASLDFFDDGFCQDDSTEGTLRVRYVVERNSHAEALAFVIDLLRADAERLGIVWQNRMLYYPSDGESTDYPPPPNWRDLLREQAERIGWETYDFKPACDGRHSDSGQEGI